MSNPKKSRRWCFTKNYGGETEVPDSEFKELIKILEECCRYAIMGKEIAPTTGTPHIQGYVSLKQAKDLNWMRTRFGSVRMANGTEQENQIYCSKGTDVIEIGKIAKPGKRNDLLLIANKINEGGSIQEISKEFPATYIRNYRGIAHYAALQIQEYEHTKVRGIWIWGPPGTGKSHHARIYGMKLGGYYLKPQNKWWDGYNGEPCVILDDFDKGGYGLGHHLKIWSDKYPCTGEIKGGTVKLQHKVFIVTSNREIDGWWKEDDDTEMKWAIIRRFEKIHLGEQQDVVDELVNYEI